MTVYLSPEQVLELHRLQMRRFGGSAGLRDRGGLEAALARPQMTFGGEDLYPDLEAKAAALLHSLVVNHPFVDGNKRVAFFATDVFLRLNGWKLEVEPRTAHRFLTRLLERGECDFRRLLPWIRSSAVRLRGR